jgi:N-methylhydantoinase B
MDVVNLDVIWSRLINTATEQRKVLLRTAFSTVLRESEDCAAGVFDVGGRLLAQAPSGTPGQINSMAICVPNFLEAFPPGQLQPGDALITNHPWKTAGHLNDITVLTPVFRGDRLVGFFGSCAHSLDIGGRGFASDSRSLYEEGLFIPFARLAEGGRVNELLLDVIRHNVRSPDLVIGDIMAQLSCNEIGAARLVDLMTEFGLDDLTDLSAEIVGRSDRVLREAIRRIPDGRYEAEVESDGLDEPVRIHCTAMVRGDEILVDYAGSSPQVRWGINVPLCYTASYTIYALKCMLTPDVPNNAATFGPIRVTAPPGSIMNALPPAPVAGRHIIGNFQPLVLYRALADVLPRDVIACSSVLWITTVQSAAAVDAFTLTFFASGGMGARPEKDGLSATSFPGNIAMTPVEMVEAVSPIVFHEKALRADSAGPGRCQGGFGQTIRFGLTRPEAYVVNTMCDQIREAPYGLAGAGPGEAGRYAVGGVALPQFKAMVTVPPRGEVVMHLPGGGGYGDPRERPVAHVLADVANGLLTPARARRDYGVVLRAGHGGFEVDVAATARRRAAGGPVDPARPPRSPAATRRGRPRRAVPGPARRG